MSLMRLFATVGMGTRCSASYVRTPMASSLLVHHQTDLDILLFHHAARGRLVQALGEQAEECKDPRLLG